MSILKNIQKQLLLESKKLSFLEESVENSLKNRETLYNIPVFFTEFFRFQDETLFSKQEKTIVNGAEDCYITRISYTEYYIIKPASTNFILTKEEISETDNYFEFRWNYRLASTQARYLSQANTVRSLSRRSLGFIDVGLPLELASPLYFAAGDAISIEAEQLLQGDLFDGTLLYFTLHGYRNGVMV